MAAMSDDEAAEATADEEDSEEEISRIEGKVAGILTKRELVINRGEADGVEIGMRFAILNPQGIDVKDPDTGVVLGSVEHVKTVVKVVRIDGPHLCTARTFRTVRGTPGISASLFAGATSLYGSPDRPETLQIDRSSTLREELDPKESFVKVGDPAVEALGDEYDDA